MKNEKLKSLNIIFENCDTCEVKVRDIAFMSIRKINKEVLLSGVNNNICEYITAEKVKLIIKNTEEYDTGYHGSLKDRLFKFRDITGVELNYENCESNFYYVKWKDADNSCDENKLQKVKIIDDGVVSFSGNDTVEIKIG